MRGDTRARASFRFATPQHPPLTPHPSPNMTDERINILVVDDVPEKLIALEAILEELGQNIVSVRSGREAL